MDSLFLYSGADVDTRQALGDIRDLIQKHHFNTKIMSFNSFLDAPLRAAVWNRHVHVMVVPPLMSYPDISPTGVTDIRAWVASGNNIVFIGSYLSVEFINNVFGFELDGDYEDGPYYRNDRNAHNNPFMYLKSRIDQIGKTYGVSSESMPPGSRSLFDTLGVSVVFSIPYDLGSIVYVGFQYDTPFGLHDWTSVLHAAISM